MSDFNKTTKEINKRNQEFNKDRAKQALMDKLFSGEITEKKYFELAKSL